MTDNNMESSVSGYVTESYEGLDTAFSEVSQLPSRGYCDLYRAKRYGRWYVCQCLLLNSPIQKAFPGLCVTGARIWEEFVH